MNQMQYFWRDWRWIRGENVSPSDWRLSNAVNACTSVFDPDKQSRERFW